LNAEKKIDPLLGSSFRPNLPTPNRCHDNGLTGEEVSDWLSYLYGDETDVGDGYKAGVLATELDAGCTVADQQSRS